MVQCQYITALSPKQHKELSHLIKTTEKKAEALRAQAILLINEGKSFAVYDFTGYSRAQAFLLRKRYADEGITCLTDKREGKPKELLTKKQRDTIVTTVKTKKPSDVGFVSDHWTTNLLGKWIESEYKVRYKSKTSLYLVFKQATFTYHKPGTVYRERSDAEVEAWKNTASRKLKKLAHESNTVILTADEMILTTRTTLQKIWLPEGEYPKIECSNGGRKRRNVYGFLNLKTGTEHAFKTDWQNMYVTKETLEKVRKIYPTQKLALFWDNAGWHKGSVVTEFIKADGNIEIVHFPRYAPEENPQEHVWKSGRTQCTHNKFIEDIDTATDELISYFNTTKFPYAMLGMRLTS